MELVTVLSPFISSYKHVAKNYGTCRSHVNIISKFKISLHATEY
jgi:hypothetical protein